MEKKVKELHTLSFPWGNSDQAGREGGGGGRSLGSRTRPVEISLGLSRDSVASPLAAFSASGPTSPRRRTLTRPKTNLERARLLLLRR